MSSAKQSEVVAHLEQTIPLLESSQEKASKGFVAVLGTYSMPKAHLKRFLSLNYKQKPLIIDMERAKLALQLWRAALAADLKEKELQSKGSREEKELGRG